MDAVRKTKEEWDAYDKKLALANKRMDESIRLSAADKERGEKKSKVRDLEDQLSREDYLSKMDEIDKEWKAKRFLILYPRGEKIKDKKEVRITVEEAKKLSVEDLITRDPLAWHPSYQLVYMALRSGIISVEDLLSHDKIEKEFLKIKRRPNENTICIAGFNLELVIQEEDDEGRFVLGALRVDDGLFLTKAQGFLQRLVWNHCILIPNLKKAEKRIQKEYWKKQDTYIFGGCVHGGGDSNLIKYENREKKLRNKYPKHYENYCQNFYDDPKTFQTYCKSYYHEPKFFQTFYTYIQKLKAFKKI